MRRDSFGIRSARRPDIGGDGRLDEGHWFEGQQYAEQPRHGVAVVLGRGSIGRRASQGPPAALSTAMPPSLSGLRPGMPTPNTVATAAIAVRKRQDPLPGRPAAEEAAPSPARSALFRAPPRDGWDSSGGARPWSWCTTGSRKPRPGTTAAPAVVLGLASFIRPRGRWAGLEGRSAARKYHQPQDSTDSGPDTGGRPLGAGWVPAAGRTAAGCSCLGVH